MVGILCSHFTNSHYIIARSPRGTGRAARCVREAPQHDVDIPKPDTGSSEKILGDAWGGMVRLGMLVANRENLT